MTAPTMTVADVARACGLSEKAVRGAVARGDLAAYKLAGRIRIDPDDYAAWLGASRVTPDRPPGPPPQSTDVRLTSRGPLARLSPPDQEAT